MDPKKVEHLYTIKWSQGHTSPSFINVVVSAIEADIQDMTEYKEADFELKRIMSL